MTANICKSTLEFTRDIHAMILVRPLKGPVKLALGQFHRREAEGLREWLRDRHLVASKGPKGSPVSQRVLVHLTKAQSQGL